MSNPIRLDVVPFRERIYAQVVDRTSRDATVRTQKGFGDVELTQTVYERYKIWIPSQMDDNVSVEQLPWARKKTVNSGLGGFQSFEPIIQTGSFVTIIEDDNGDWVIDEVLPNVVCDGISSELVLGKASSGFPSSYYQGLKRVPTTYQTPDGASIVCELPNAPQASREDEKQDKHNKTETLLSACKKIDTTSINQEIEDLIKDVEDIKTGLLGEDSFLVTSQNFIDDEILERVNEASAKVAEYSAWLVQEIRKYVLRKVNAGINDLTGNAPLTTRYLVNEAKDEALNTISCLFINILSNLENLIYELLSELVDEILNTSTCLIENFISNFVGQIVSQLTDLINLVLEPISSLLGSVISFTSEILDFAISILELLICKPENICPQIEKWNPLDGPVSSNQTLDFNSIFQSAQGVADSFQGVFNIPENLEDYEFVFDAQAALNATLDNCNVGPEDCGVPNAVFWGGTGEGATGNVVVNAVGDIIGVDIVLPGEYDQAPIIEFEDNCGSGVGAQAIPILGDVEVTDTGAGDDGGTDTDTGADTDGTGGETRTTTGVTGVVVTNPGYGYLPSPNGSRGGMGRVWANRCQTTVRRANRSWDAPYNEGDIIKLYYGDRIKLPGQAEVLIDCDFNVIELPGSIESGEKYCYQDMSGFDDGASGDSSDGFNIKSMVGFDDIRGSSTKVTPPVSIEHQQYWQSLAESERGVELLEEERLAVESGAIPQVGRPDQFGFYNDYPYARELGFSDTDIRFYIEGFYSKLLGKKIGPIMKLVLEDPNFGPIPKRLSGGAGVFDCENDYPYALSLGFNDKDIRYYLENVYRGKIDECMQKKLNDPNFGRVDYYVELTAPGCPPEQQVGDYEVISEIGDVYIDDGGFGYQPGDTATVLDCSGNPDAAAKIEITVNQSGTITGAKVISPGTNFTCIPEIILNTDTGYNARLIPVLKFRRAEDIDVPPGTQVLQVIDCVGRV